MNAHIFIVLRSFRNTVKETLHKPAKLIMYLFVLAMIIGLAVVSIFIRKETENPASLFWFTGILFLYISIFVISSFYSGLSGGGTFFEMNDVNFLFVSPVDSRKTLLYGIIRMAKSAFIASFFILFQSGTLANFGVGFNGVLLTIAGFLLSVMTLTLLSLVIYSTSNGRPARKRIYKCIAVLLYLPLAAFLFFELISTGDAASAIDSAVNSPFFRFVPVCGWSASGVAAFLSGDSASGLLFFGFNFLLGAALTLFILLTNPDYYEDVLVATETAFEKKRALNDGNINSISSSKHSVKIRNTGIPFFGAAALFSKHMRENMRQSRFGFLPLLSIIIVISGIIASFFIRDFIILMQILMWVQIFLIGTGRGLKETYSHYIYLIPESSFKKILWSNMEIMSRTLLENVLLFSISAVIINANPIFTLVCILAYTLFSFLLLGINYLSMRFTGADISAGLLITIYCLAVIIAMAPGIAGAIIVGVIIGGESGSLLGLLTLSAWELAAGLLFFALARGVLHNCDMAHIKTGK